MKTRIMAPVALCGVILVSCCCALWFGLGCLGCADDGGADGLRLRLEGPLAPCWGEAVVPETLRVAVLERDAQQVVLVADKEFAAGGTEVSISHLPSGVSLEIIVTGRTADHMDGPVTFGRVSDVIMDPGQDNAASVLLHKYAGFSQVESPPGVPNVLFPSATLLPDGRVLLAGGLSQVKDVGPGGLEITGARKEAYIYDSHSGQMRQVKSPMNQGRGAAAALYLPGLDKVLVVGGAETLHWTPDDSCFPWYFLKEDVGNVGFTYELFDAKTETFLNWEDDWPDLSHEFAEKVPRVFPQATLNSDGSVLVTGGGAWPSCQTNSEVGPAYKVADFYRPASSVYDGGFLDSNGALTMLAMRAGHATATVADSKGNMFTLFWGGAVSGPTVETYVESPAQYDGVFGVFEEVVFLDKSAYKKRPFFHSLTPLTDQELLLIGGVHGHKGDLVVPSAGEAYRVQLVDKMIHLQKLDGLSEGRYFHTAVAGADGDAVIFGGFGGVVVGVEKVFSQSASTDMRFYDRGKAELSLPPIDENGPPWGGGAAVGLPSGCVFLAGGVDDLFEGLSFAGPPVALEPRVFCPSSVCSESLWGGNCYEYEY